ncbi:MAG TPA: hypothetical protein PLF00_03395, partial [Candidatus Marinimicrobia bacterium]|nr:hypothetical protein [Candidatus Neomarinimicrobiota bacterium]
MTSAKKFILLLNTMIVTVLSLLLFLSSCPEEPDNYDDSDTTSHDFLWETYTFGDLASSDLNDVVVVDENNIWAVGEIFVYDPDSSWNGTGIETFNAVHWNGTEWEYIHIRGSLMNDTGPLYSIWYFDECNIWVTTFGLPIHWDGNEWTLYHIQNMGIDASAGYGIWASSPSNIYFVGYKGSI